MNRRETKRRRELFKQALYYRIRLFQLEIHVLLKRCRTAKVSTAARSWLEFLGPDYFFEFPPGQQPKKDADYLIRIPIFPGMKAEKIQKTAVLEPLPKPDGWSLLLYSPITLFFCSWSCPLPRWLLFRLLRHQSQPWDEKTDADHGNTHCPQM